MMLDVHTAAVVKQVLNRDITLSAQLLGFGVARSRPADRKNFSAPAGVQIVSRSASAVIP